MGSNFKGKNLDIEVLRAIAVIMTLYHHRHVLLFWEEYPYEGFFTFWGGVDLFFVISGFVIARGLLERWRQARSYAEFGAEMVAFWLKRFWRIWPTSLLWICIVAFLTALMAGKPIGGGERWGDFLSGLHIYASSILGLANISFATVPTGFNPLNHYWSLSLEEQFYFIFPIILLILLNRTSWLLSILVACILGQFFWIRAVWSVGWAVRSDALLLGIVIAIVTSWPTTRISWEPVFIKGRPWLSILSTALLLLLNVVVASGSTVPFVVGQLAIICGVLVFFASFDSGYIFPSCGLKNVLVFIGSRSYAIYVIHFPAYYIVRLFWFWFEGPSVNIGGTFTFRFIASALIFTFLLAELNYRFLETPLRRRGKIIADSYRERCRVALSTT